MNDPSLELSLVRGPSEVVKVVVDDPDPRLPSNGAGSVTRRRSGRSPLAPTIGRRHI